MICAYVGSGLQLFIAGSLFAWLPSYLGRAYGLAPDKAAGVAAIAILFMGVGMIVCGTVTDRLARHVAIRKWTTAIVYSLRLAGLPRRRLLPARRAAPSCCCSPSASSSPPAPPARPARWSSNLTHESIRATAFGTLTLANNLLGLAAGPLVTGILADRFGLVDRHADRSAGRRRRADLPAARPPGLPGQPRQGQRARRSPDERRDRRPRPGPAGPRRGPLADAAGRDAAGRADRAAARPHRTRACRPASPCWTGSSRTSTGRWSSWPTAPASWSRSTGPRTYTRHEGRRARCWRHRRRSPTSCRRSTRRSRSCATTGGCPSRAAPLPFPSIVAASSNDPLGNPVAVRAPWRRRGGAGWHSLGAVGHLNPASGFGDWPEARRS